MKGEGRKQFPITRRIEVTPQDPIERSLKTAGYRSNGRKEFDERCKKKLANPRKPPRFCYEKGNIRILLGNLECPWYTVQYVSDDKVRWFVDIPRECPTPAIFAFARVIGKS